MECCYFRESITDYLEGETGPSVSLLMDRHKAGCFDCRLFLEQLLTTVALLGKLGSDKSAPFVSPKALDALRKARRGESQLDGLDQKNLLDSMIDMTVKERLDTLSLLEIESLRSLAQFAESMAIQQGLNQPLLAVTTADVALVVQTEICARVQQDWPERSKLAEAWGVVGNARRICSDFRGAFTAFSRAEEILDSIDSAESSRARVLQLKSALQAEMGASKDALSSIEEAIRIFSLIGDTHHYGRALICKGTILGPVGESAEAVQVLNEGLDLIDEEKEPRLVLVAKHNLVHSLVECQELELALLELKETQSLHRELPNELDRVRLRWLEGGIELELGRLDEAEKALVQVRRFFAESEIAHDAALVSLDLAMVYLKQGRIAELKSLASEMVTVFGSLGIGREVVAALAFFNKALEIEHSAAVGVLQEYLEQVRSREDFRHRLTVSS